MLGINNTIFFFGNLPSLVLPLLQLGVVVVALTESNSIIKIRKIQELAARPSSNLTVLSGHVASASMMVFTIAFANVFMVFVATSFASLAGFNYGNVPSIISVANLLLFDLPATLLFWSSFALFIRILVKNGATAFAFASIAATFTFLLIFVVPFNWVSALSSYSYDVMVVSDVVPRFPDAEILLNRAGVIAAALALLVLSALIWNRLDANRYRYVWSGFALILVSASIFCLQVSIIASDEQDRQDWSKAHNEFEVEETVDLVKLSGKIAIDPGRSLNLDLELVVQTPENFASSEMLFSFNPGMTIHRLAVDQSDQEFKFERGILSIPLPCDPCIDPADVLVSIHAQGKPNELFGNLDPEIDFLGSAGVAHHARKYFGTQNSIFSKRFVALMPASRWYPVPGSLKVDQYVEALQIAPDLFDVELAVTVASEDWNVAGPGYKTRHSVEGNTFTFRTGQEIPQFAIIASRFESRSTTVEGFHLEALLHRRHSDLFDELQPVTDKFTSNLTQRLRSLSSVGIEFKNASVTLVEVPNYLRTVGGYGMKFQQSFPGVILIKESSIPLSNFDDIKERQSRNLSRDENLDEKLLTYFQEYNARNLVGGNIVQALAEQLYPYAYKQFETDNVALNYLRRLLIADSFARPEHVYTHVDAEVVASFARLMTAHPVTTLDFLFKRHNTHYPPILDSSMIEYVFIGSEARVAESALLRELDTLENSIEGYKVLYLRVWEVYRAMHEMFSTDSLHKIVAPMRDPVDVADGEDSFEYLYRAAASIEEGLGVFVRDWLTTDAIPGFRASEVTSRVVDAPDSPWTQHISFDIRNDREANGVVQFLLGGELEDIKAGPSVEIQPNSSYRVNLYSKEPVFDVLIGTFYSMNGGLVSRRIPPVDNDDDVSVSIRPMVEPSNWQPEVVDYIVIDNLDEGIELIGDFKERPSFLNRMSSWMNFYPEFPTIQRNGVEYGMMQSWEVNDAWTHVNAWTAYGLYRQTAWVAYSDSPPTVRFTAELPREGKWNLQYHYPYLDQYAQPYGQYSFVLRDNETEHPISLYAKDLSGWVDLGTFEIEGPTVQLDLVAVEPSDSRKVVDAVRWRLDED